MTLALSVTNVATGSLDSGINSVVTTLDVKAGEGALFPTTAGSEYFYVTLQAEDGAWEIVKVTERASDAFTIVRNVDSSTGSAQAFTADDIVSLRPVAEVILDIITELNLMNPAGTLTAPTGTAMPFYQASAPTGWTIIGAVADVLLGFKGGTEDYNDTAGTLVGSWTQTNHAHADVHTHELDHVHSVLQAALEHNHQWLNIAGGDDETYNAAGAAIVFNKSGGSGDEGVVTDASGDKVMGTDSYTNMALDGGAATTEQPGDATTDSQSAETTSGAAQVNTDRPYTALCIMADKD